MKAVCPKNKNHKKFITSAHVVQDWIVDENGDFIEEAKSDVVVTHYPNKDNTWTCEICGEEALIDD